MSKRLRNAAAKRVIEEMEHIREMGQEDETTQIDTAKVDTAKIEAVDPTLKAEPVVVIEKQPKEQLNTNVDVRVKQAIMMIQADVVAKGFKKPKIGEIIEDAVMKLLTERGLSLEK